MNKKIVKHYNLGKKRKLSLVSEYKNNSYLSSSDNKTSGMAIGHAISNPMDKFDKKIGELIATNRLHHPDGKVLYGAEIDAKYMSTYFIEAQMDVLAEFIKENLHIIIKGYKK